MIFAAIAQRYARAIFELALEGDDIASTTQGLDDIARVYAGSPELESVLLNPEIEPDEINAILQELGKRLGLGPLAIDSVRVLARRRRLGALPEIAEQLKTMADAHAGVLRAAITSAVPLNDAFRREIVEQLEKSTRRKIVAEFNEDPTLIAGILTRIGDTMLDGSIRGRLVAIERQLLQT